MTPPDWDAGLITAWTGATVAILTMIGGVIAWGVKTLRDMKADQLEQVAQMVELLTRADHQLHPNSGKSLADKIDQLVEDTRGLRTDMSQMRTDMSQMRTELREERTARHDGDQHIVIKLSEAQDKADVDHAAILQHVEQRHQTLRQMIDQALDRAGILEEDD